MKGREIRRRYAGIVAAMVFFMTFLPYLHFTDRAYGAVSFGGGEISYSEELVALWDQLAAQDGAGLERTDFIGHMTPTYPQPGIVIYKQQTSVSPGGKWKDYQYRNMYCISHSRELAENPNTTMETTAIWYIKKEPYTLQNLPPFIVNNTADEYCRRLNFLLMAYAANHEAYQGTVNSDPVINTANYYLCQSFCTLSEEAKFTGEYGHDWGIYQQHTTQIAQRYNPSGLGSTQVYQDMMRDMERTFRSVWNTAKLAADCVECSDTGYVFRPVISLGEDGFYHASYPLTPETREFFGAASILPYGDWTYEMTETGLDFRSQTGQIPEGGNVAEINLENANGIIRKWIGRESIRELHMPVKLGNRWSLTFAQGNLISNLKDGLKILVGTSPGEDAPGYGGSSVMRYKHTEKWQADYVVNLRKLDSETGKPLENVWFDILEAFDDSQLEESVLEDDNWDNDKGSQFIRWRGWDSPYGDNGDPDPCQKDQEVTGPDGWLVEAGSYGVGELQPSGVRAHRDIKYYSYTKGYCGGHPEPEPEDEEAVEEYEREIEVCENLVSAGGFYHSLDAGAAELLEADRDKHYEAFVSLTYDYSARELSARKGYIVHNQDLVHQPFENIFDGVHRDTVPIETITIHSSQYYDLQGKNQREEYGWKGISETGIDLMQGFLEGECVSERETEGEKESQKEDELMAEERKKGDEMAGEVRLAETATLFEIPYKIIEKGEDTFEKQSENSKMATMSDAEETEGPEETEIQKTVIVPLATGSNSNYPIKTEVISGEEVNLDEIWILDEEEEWKAFEGSEMASPSNGTRLFSGSIRNLRQTIPLFSSPRSKPLAAGREVSLQPSPLALIVPADPDYSGRQGADWSFEVYDHRTEGEIHINKRDLLLKKGEGKNYDSYGDTQGDGTLEGAVYGLYAAADLIHPDGKTGVVFEKGNLVAVATTDKNGDASFMAITEAPGTFYDYSLGAMARTGFSGPTNKYIRTVHEYTSNPDGNGQERWYYPLSDNQSKNGNCWIGRPLLLGSYYVQELTRSEGYELSVYGVEAEVSNRNSFLAGGSIESGGNVLVEKTEGNICRMEDTGEEEMVTEITLSGSDTKYGWDISIKNIDPRSMPSFWITKKGKREEYCQWREPETYYEPVEAVAGTQVMIEGKSVEAVAGEWIDLPNGETVLAEHTKEFVVSPEKRYLTGQKGAIPAFDTQYIPELTGGETGEEKFAEMCNQAFLSIGMEWAGTDAPYFLIELGEDKSQWAEKMYNFFEDEKCPAFNGAFFERVIRKNGENYGVLRYSFLEKGQAQPVVYSASDDTFYVKYSVKFQDGAEGYLYRGYPLSAIPVEDRGAGNHLFRWVRVPNEKPAEEKLDPYQDLSALSWVSAEKFKSFWVYGEGELLRDEKGGIYQKEKIRYVDREGYQVRETIDYEKLKEAYDPLSRTWKIHVPENQILEKEKLLMTIRYGNRFTGEGRSPVVTAVPSMNLTKTYMRQVTLAYPGQDCIYEDGGTRKAPVEVWERAIVQRVEVFKDIEKTSYNHTNSYGKVHKDWFTWLFGGFSEEVQEKEAATRMDNFRFKIYLRSNLSRLYRTEKGKIVWQNRQGQDLGEEEVLAENRAFPGLVRKIYTKVTHKTDPLYADSRDAIVANEALYGYSDGKIHEEARKGYTAVLETEERLTEDGQKMRTVKVPNYDKFFQAIYVANADKWDDGAPTYTSWQPVGNEANRTKDSIENVKVSDQVRQFAIDWYLEDEVRKLVKPVEENETEKEAKDKKVSYPDEIYDHALREAIIKAENYLVPFFAYDLDEIYGIQWDEASGGKDHDRTTLSADVLAEKGDESKGYCGLSSYLPYGTYVVVEQQPKYAGAEYGRNQKDFKNKHYQIDRPKEVVLPSVYEGTEGFLASPERTNNYYCYDASMAGPEMERKYRIRFNQENHQIFAHSHYGDFEIYKYGMDVDLLDNGVPPVLGKGNRFALTQSTYNPYKNYYNQQDDREGAKVDFYLTEGQSGREGIAGQYRYSSVSEHRGVMDNVPFFGGTSTEDNVPGTGYRDQVPVMQGMQTACDKQYASMLVPWSILGPDRNQGTFVSGGKEEATGESDYTGFACAKFRNRFFTARLRLEKLDGETHENILHDSAVFAVYGAKREASEDGSGRVCFYEKDTTIFGTRGFLESMGALDIRPMARKLSLLDRLLGKNQGPGNLYTGVVPAGTPMCEESEKIILGDGRGQQTVAFSSFSTVLDEQMKEELEEKTMAWQLQTAGYLETPQPLGAGAYVICEEKAPSGYVRSKPIALEIYSDKVTYYKEGNKDSRVLAAIYEIDAMEQTANKNKPQDRGKLARVNVENVPIKLTVEKLKESSARAANTTGDKTVTYKVSGRVDGSLVEIGGDPDYEYAYENGCYLGYGWRKGTLEYLASRKAAGELVEIAYEGAVFAGYGYVTRKLETADDANTYVAGARMVLFDAIVLKASGDIQDHAYEGLEIKRNSTNNVIRMYVKQGYAGKKTEFVKKRNEKGEEYVTEIQTGVDSSGNPVKETGAVWGAETLERPDTDILFYDLDSLEVTVTRNIDGRSIVYGYDKNHNKVSVAQAESEKANFSRTDTDHSLFAFKGGIPFLEFVGGDFTKLGYSSADKILKVDEKTLVYHLDKNGNRDCLVDPYTGMAYVVPEEGPEGMVMVWAVHTHRDEYGNVIARDKITTCRVATIGENQEGYEEKSILQVINHSGHEIPQKELPSYEHNESGSITGTWESQGSGESHQETTFPTNSHGQNLNQEVLTDENNGSFAGELNPVYDNYGLPQYYQRSEAMYDKGTELYDRNGDFVRYQDSDNLEKYNHNAYHINPHGQLYDGDEKKEQQIQKKLYHRQGEGYILENIWTTSDKTPNDPFDTEEMPGQPDILKRVPAGSYIIEELDNPSGYVKAMPVGTQVREIADMQIVSMVDKTIKVEFPKIDGTDTRRIKISGIWKDGSSRDLGEMTEGKGSYSYGPVSGARLALFPAKRVYSPDLEKGYYLKKIGEEPVSYESTDSRAGSLKWQKASWVTGEIPVYTEGLPAGTYILEELVTPSGFVTIKPQEVEIMSTEKVQVIPVYNDHTKIEIEKYVMEQAERKPVFGAGFTLYKAITSGDGNVICQDGAPVYDSGAITDTWTTSDPEEYFGFIPAFEAMYQDFGTEDGTVVLWDQGKKTFQARHISSSSLDASVSGGEPSRHPTAAVLIFQMDDGRKIRVTVTGEDSFEYQFDYHKLTEINPYACSYVTTDGVRRIDYLPVGEAYVLVETQVPKGYAKAEDQVILAKNTGNVQRYMVENMEGRLYISKEAEGRRGELTGAYMELFRAGEDGSFLADKEHLEAWWITGTDGIYSEEDFVNGRIPSGYKKGDLRPHEIGRLSDGIYWLREQKSPEYYTLMEPVRIDYHQQEEIRVVRVLDQPVKGSLEVRKTDLEGNPLTGAVFELTAYKKDDMRNPVQTQCISDHEGTLRINNLLVGEVQADGQIEPYLYKLREIVPPEGYAVNTQIFTWEFEPDTEGSSYKPGHKAEKQIQVTDRKTRVSIGKKDFDAMGHGTDELLVGAEMAIYEITGRDEKGQLLYDLMDPKDQWTTGEKEHVTEGLTAGKSYLLKELSAPLGYDLFEPVLFTMSLDGRRIVGISNQLNTITIHSDSEDEEKRDLIQAVTLKGRYPVRTEYELRDVSGRRTVCWTGNRDGHRICLENGWREGEPCVITERTLYSDGSVAVTGKRTEILAFGEDKYLLIPGRQAIRTSLSLSHRDGTQIDFFYPNEVIQEKTIQNHIPSADSGKALFNKGESYILTEYTIFSDGDFWESSRIMFTIDEKAAVGGIIAPDRKTKVSLSKTDITGEKELFGCEMSITDKDGKEIRSWVSGKEPYVIEGVLKPGESYCLRENHPCDGFAWAEEIWFTLSQGGIREQVIMKDDITKVQVQKLSEGFHNKPVEGAVLQILNLDGTPAVAVWDQEPYKKGEELIFVTGTDPIKLWQQLSAGQEYLLHEVKPAPGYAYAEDMRFTVRRDGREEMVIMTDSQTRVSFHKTDITGEKELPGNHLQIKALDGKEIASWISSEEPYELAGVLNAGETYILEEIRPCNGFAWSEEIRFTVSLDGSLDKVYMKNEKTQVEIIKTDAVNGKPISGAALEIRDNQGRILEQWTSGEESHKITGKLLAGEQYFLYETKAPDGYRLAGPLRFQMPKEAEILKLTFENHKKDVRKEHPKDPGTPGTDQLEPPREPGYVTAWYDTGIPLAGREFSDQIPKGFLRLDSAGDASFVKIYGVVFVLSFFGAAIAFFAIQVTKRGRFAIISGRKAGKKTCTAKGRESRHEKNGYRHIGPCGCGKNHIVGEDSVFDREDPQDGKSGFS
ncbi:MAG: hypothetical protein HFG54_03445 [Lachnospiraceae bacterium]|jgi:hypothetical protein|nr:hypothetical protein [Lachnospiraceae bacterium]